jgi:predicted Fe-Mo cluster-binding NifX family protein
MRHLGGTAILPRIGTGFARPTHVQVESVAITVLSGRISPLFDVSQRVLLFVVSDGRVLERSELPLPNGSGAAKLEALRDRQAHTILCGAVSREIEERAAAMGLRMVPFLAGEIEEVLEAYLRNGLPSERLTMPGWRAGARHKGGVKGRRP